LTFESGCRIASVGDSAFAGCSSLPGISIPASLRQMTGLAMAGSGISSVTVDRDSRFFRMAGAGLSECGGLSRHVSRANCWPSLKKCFQRSRSSIRGNHVLDMESAKGHLFSVDICAIFQSRG
jgi:hypothetical protein